VRLLQPLLCLENVQPPQCLDRRQLHLQLQLQQHRVRLPGDHLNGVLFQLLPPHWNVDRKSIRAHGVDSNAKPDHRQPDCGSDRMANLVCQHLLLDCSSDRFLEVRLLLLQKSPSYGAKGQPRPDGHVLTKVIRQPKKIVLLTFFYLKKSKSVLTGFFSGTIKSQSKKIECSLQVG